MMDSIQEGRAISACNIDRVIRFGGFFRATKLDETLGISSA